VTIAGIYLAAHLAFLSPSLEDIDSINFAFGLRRFDVASHQPHPPGSPVYIALGRTSQAIVRAAAPSLDRVRVESLALALWSAIAGAIALIASLSIFSSISLLDAERSRSKPRASGAIVWAGALLAAAPLFWIAGSRPMSDMPGLAAALVSQALFFTSVTDRRALVIGAVVAGLAAGIRVQTACLTLPVFALALIRQRTTGLWWIVSRPTVALAIGGLVWVIPLIVLSGGVDGYLRALGSQADEDFAWTAMLWTTPSPRRLLFALWETFVLPWESIPLGIVVGALAAAGAVVAAIRRRYAMLWMALAFGPYALFHLLFQETVHVRYAMPTLPAMVWLVGCATSVAGRLAPVLSGLIIAGALWYSVPTGIAYGQETHPAFRAIAAMQRAALETPPAAVHAHFSLRRPLQAAAADPLRLVEPRRSFEWLGLVEYWRDGGRAPIWFLADPRRTDLALLDPQSRREVTRFGWAVGSRPELGGTRPLAADWYRINPPGWFAGQGWGLTPETGGVAQAGGTGVDRRPIEAFVRRRSGPLHLLVGGRHFSAAGDPPVVITVSIDSVEIESWTIVPGPGGVSFLRFVDLPGGLPPGTGDYARLVITARAEPASRPTPQVAIRQFDIQSTETLIHGFGEGWHEAEYDNGTGLFWRWTSGRSVLRVSPPQAVAVRLRGESPLKYFGDVPTVRIRAGDRIAGEFRPATDFEWTVHVPADVVRSSDGAIAIETDRIYLPGEAEGTSDSRQLGLRLFEIGVDPDIH
jgi:hypothetical protein